MRAAIYARYSSDLQSASSAEDQIAICKERIAREGWTLAGIFVDEGISGASMLRPGYQNLLQVARSGGCDVVVAEALDRISRDQEHVAALFKQMIFAGVRIVTLAEGEIGELHVGLKGTMNALFLKDLADKTRRGLKGRIEKGRAGGGLCFGYSVRREMAVDGSPIRGGRVIDETEAAIVRQIFADFAAGKSPRKIAFDLNDRGVPGTPACRLGRLDHQWQPRPRHRHPQQRALSRPAGLEPPALHEGPGYRQAALTRRTLTMPWSSMTCRSCGSSMRRCGRRSRIARRRWRRTPDPTLARPKSLSTSRPGPSSCSRG